jgi:DNA-binding IclR family transcriptional regulator
MRSKANQPTVPAAARTIALFEVFAREQRELTKSDVARLLDLPESSSSDLLNTLYELGYLGRTVTSRRFYPTSRLLDTARAIGENDPLGDFGSEMTGLLADRSGESCCAAIMDKDAVRIVAITESKHRLRFVARVGDLFPLHATAVGKSLLATLDDQQLARLLRLRPLTAMSDRTKTDPREVEAEIAEYRERGWFQTRGEGGEGLSAIAKTGYHGGVPVALTLVGPTERMDEHFDEYVQMLQEVVSNSFPSHG